MPPLGGPFGYPGGALSAPASAPPLGGPVNQLGAPRPALGGLGELSGLLPLLLLLARIEGLFGLQGAPTPEPGPGGLDHLGRPPGPPTEL